MEYQEAYEIVAEQKRNLQQKIDLLEAQHATELEQWRLLAHRLIACIEKIGSAEPVALRELVATGPMPGPMPEPPPMRVGDFPAQPFGEVTCGTG